LVEQFDLKNNYREIRIIRIEIEIYN